ncbi:Sigma-54 interaction domain family [Synechococcus sp. PCC 7335]|uniref:cyclic nucleotide-binding domain-containing protein n=1 Tax=Synechococcus sp. (strain ATCC 29403 / PCC 7335) TaxID=91464 RepID=UPI00017ED21D|nr:cyclic nucleotide-binding domain-containing protein [Synechococcus sp. PCC 7335]EDX85164.1 Sigma-54 interaction domain family [Synechococcus sp. PCC 7335]
MDSSSASPLDNSESSFELGLSSEEIEWLRTETIFRDLSPALIEAIAPCLYKVPFAANRRLILEDTKPDALYILRAGQLESYRTRRASQATVTELHPGEVLHLQALLLEIATAKTVVSQTDCLLWKLEKSRFMQLAQDYPELNGELSKLLAACLEDVSEQLAYEQERQQALRPYLVTRVKRGVVGRSRYASRLRQNIRDATSLEAFSTNSSTTEERRPPVLIFGEPGLNKDNLAALIHFGSANKKQPMIQVNCENLRSQDLFGRGDSQPGLLEWLGSGTLLLNNIQDLDEKLKAPILSLLEDGSYRPVSREGDAPAASRRSFAWILVVAEKALPEVAKRCALQVKVPPLRLRKADIEALVTYFAQLLCRQRKRSKVKLDSAALRRLQSYDFPGNLTELESMVERAVNQSEGYILTEEVFWAEENEKRRFRFDLLQGYPNLRQFLLSPWWPDRINYGFTLWFYPIIVAVLMWGPQARQTNFALNFFWAWWWPLVLIGFPFVGRLWCAVCPFMIYGEVVQKLSLIAWPRQLKAWPRTWAERWGGWILYGGFALILLWEELWNLENTAYLSGWLLLIITAGAIVCSVLFERRFWCRYLCPIGGMNGLFAKLSMIELRAQQGICSATCNTYHCYKGGPAEGEGQATGGCPVYSHPAQLSDNRNCVLCMTCLKACPHKSVALNLRPPGIELWTTHQPTSYEVALLLLLLGAVFLHRLPQLTTMVLGDETVLNNFGGHAIAASIALFLPGAIALLVDKIRVHFQGTGANRDFLTLAYGYLPLVLLASLAHYLLLGLSEGGQVISVFGATIGWPIVGFQAIVDPAVIAFLQGTSLLLGACLSIILTQKIGRQSWLKLIPQHSLTLGFTLLFWQLIV